jgi:hypothetical protein
MIRIPFLGDEYQERKASEIIIIECNSVLVCNKKRYRNKEGKIKEGFQINKREGKAVRMASNYIYRDRLPLYTRIDKITFRRINLLENKVPHKWASHQK